MHQSKITGPSTRTLSILDIPTLVAQDPTDTTVLGPLLLEHAQTLSFVLATKYAPPQLDALTHDAQAYVTEIRSYMRRVAESVNRDAIAAKMGVNFPQVSKLLSLDNETFKLSSLHRLLSALREILGEHKDLIVDPDILLAQIKEHVAASVKGIKHDDLAGILDMTVGNVGVFKAYSDAWTIPKIRRLLGAGNIYRKLRQKP